MNKLIDAHKFAKLVVSSTKLEGTNEEIISKTLALYELAYDKCEERNLAIKQQNDKKTAESHKALLKTFGK